MNHGVSPCVYYVDPREIFDSETFRPMCADGEVVVMSDAKYGRMTIGRCVRTDYGYVSCGVNVLSYLDSKCSGRRSCEVSIPDQGLKNVIANASNACPREFKTYLNASYNCYEGNTVTQCVLECIHYITATGITRKASASLNFNRMTIRFF